MPSLRCIDGAQAQTSRFRLLDCGGLVVPPGHHPVKSWVLRLPTDCPPYMACVIL